MKARQRRRLKKCKVCFRETPALILRWTVISVPGQLCDRCKADDAPREFAGYDGPEKSVYHQGFVNHSKLVSFENTCED